MARTPFKLKSGNNIKGSAFKAMGSSPAKRADVFIDEENIGTGDVTKEKVAEQKAINEALIKADKTSDVSPKGKVVEKKTISYTGQDAVDAVLASDMTPQEKRTNVAYYRAHPEEKYHGQVKTG